MGGTVETVPREQPEVPIPLNLQPRESVHQALELGARHQHGHRGCAFERHM